MLLVACGLFSACSKSRVGTHKSSFPKSAQEVIQDARYRNVFTSDSGISYYIRKLAADEVAKMPEDNVITGEKSSLLYVPIKGGQIVVAPLADRMALGYKIPNDMME